MAYDPPNLRIDGASFDPRSASFAARNRLASLPNKSNIAIEREAEIPCALGYLDKQLGELYATAKVLEHRLSPVLRAAPPENGNKVGFTSVTPHGGVLRECAGRASSTREILADILDRLEL